MKWIRRIGLALAGLLVLVAIGLASWEPLTATRMAAPPARTYDVKIVRDDFGVPHIFGKSDPDVAYGIGYAHAEDDFATLQEVLAMTRGRLGAITGQPGAATDYVVHLLGARATVARDYAKQPADVRALLDAYAAGLNRYAEKHPGEVRLSKLFPVNGMDVATGFVVRSPFFYGLDGVLGALAGDKKLPIESAGEIDAPNVTPLGPDAAKNGSNAFLVAPKRSADGFTRLVSNTHQPWRGGAAWYELVVHSEAGWHFAGATFPGAPYPLMGHNQHLGWTNTVNRPDVIDVYRMRVEGDQYRYDGELRSLETRTVWLPVKLWGPFVLPVPRKVQRAVQGPVITNKAGSFAIRYGGADQLRMVEQYYRLNRAQDFATWERAMSAQGIPGTNFLYADKAGNIAYFYNAAFPNRKPGYDYSKVLPGDTSRAYAPGTVPWAAVPRNINPGSGFLQNANNSPLQAAGQGFEIDPRAWPPLLGIETDTTNRGTRALELLGADGSITREELRAIKFDTAVSRHSWLWKWYDAIAAAEPKGDATLIKARDMLRGWDRNFDGKGADALAYSLLRVPNRWHHERKPAPDARTVLAEGSAYLLKHFGRLDVPLGDLIRLKQGKVDLPFDGGPDVLRAATNYDELPDGRLSIRHGDSFLMFVEWDKAGRVRSESVVPFGAANTRPDSPHHTDQAKMFVEHRTKPVRFNPPELRGHIERVYRP